MRDIHLADADNDCALEIVVTRDVSTHLIAPASFAEKVWIPYGANASAVGHVDTDSANEIVFVNGAVLELQVTTYVEEWDYSGYADGVVHSFGADAHALEWRSSTTFFNRNAWTGIHDVAIGDVDDDGDTEIVVGTDRLYDGALYVISGKTHTVEHQSLYDSGSPIHAVSIADFDGDGSTKVVAGGDRKHTGAPGTFVYVIDGATGTVEWKSMSLGSY